MTDYFNDSPIQSIEDDRYGVSSFANSLAKSIHGIKQPIGTTIALHGPWGSGKSSAVNLIRSALEKDSDESLEISDFKCWWFRGEEALALAFLKNLNSMLIDTIGDKVKSLVPSVGKGILQAGSIIGPAVALASTGPLGVLASGSTNFIKKFFPEGETLEKTFQKLSEALKEQDKRFLIIIDDIDRLAPDEALSIFRLVKTVGHLPNVMYLLVYDRTLAEKAVYERYPSEGPHFLEKIIQAGFEIPTPLQDDINNAVLKSVEEICGPIPDALHRRIYNCFFDVVAPYISIPRHVVRFQNTISVTWPAIKDEVNIGDFIALETIRLYEPKLYEAIRNRKSHVIGRSLDSDPDRMADTRFEPFLDSISEDRKETVTTALQRLFPRLENVGYGADFIAEWDAERRVCSEKHFDTYFRLSLGEDVLSTTVIAELCEKADDRGFIMSAMQDAAKVTRGNGKSMVPVLLNELNTNASKIKPTKFTNLLSALFEVHDEIDLEQDDDRGFAAMGSTSLRYHWLIRRLTLDTLTLDERTEIFLTAIENSSLGWLVDFVSSAYDNHHGDESEKSESQCLVNREAVAVLVQKALIDIRAAAADGRLRDHQDLLFILYRWRDFLEKDPTEVKQWTDSLLNNDDDVVVLAKAMTSYSVSSSLGWTGIGDHTSKITPYAQIDSRTDILDPVFFKQQLVRIQSEAKLDTGSLEIVTTFLDTWNKKAIAEG